MLTRQLVAFSLRLDLTEHCIAGYTLRFGDAARPRLRATALLSIELRSGPTVLDRLKSLPAVESVHTCSGRFDLIVQLAADSTSELDDTLDEARRQEYRVVVGRVEQRDRQVAHLAEELHGFAAGCAGWRRAADSE